MPDRASFALYVEHVGHGSSSVFFCGWTYPATLPSHGDSKHVDPALKCLKYRALSAYLPNLAIFLPVPNLHSM